MSIEWVSKTLKVCLLAQSGHLVPMATAFRDRASFSLHGPNSAHEPRRGTLRSRNCPHLELKRKKDCKDLNGMTYRESRD